MVSVFPNPNIPWLLSSLYDRPDGTCYGNTLRPYHKSCPFFKLKSPQSVITIFVKMLMGKIFRIITSNIVTGTSELWSLIQQNIRIVYSQTEWHYGWNKMYLHWDRFSKAYLSRTTDLKASKRTSYSSRGRDKTINSRDASLSEGREYEHQGA